MTDDELDARLREAVIGEPLETAALERAIRARTRRSYRGWYAATAALAAIILLAISLRGTTPQTFRDAARDHRLEVVEHRARHWRTTPPEGLDVAPAGYRLEHLKTCRIGGVAVLHLVYTDGVHEVSVYIDANAGKGDAEVDGQHVTAFSNGRVKGLVVGTAEECRHFAGVIQRLT
jgi:hypothetical protein